MTTTLDKVRELLANRFSLPVESISADSTLESLKLDSLDLIETLFDLEDEFHVRMPQDRREDLNLVTVQDVTRLIERLIAQQQSAASVSNPSK